MRVVFVHDNPFVLHNGRVYSQGSISSRTWRRFLAHADEMVVVARQREVPPSMLSGLNHADTDNVRFNLVRELPFSRLLPGWKNALTALRGEIAAADAVIVRVPSILGRHAAHIGLSMNKPVACEVVGCPLDSYWYHGTLAGKLLAGSEYLRMRRVVSRASLAVYVTKDFLQQRYPCGGQRESASNVELIPPSHSVLQQRLDRIEARSEGVYRIGLIGSYKHRYKGWDTAIRALQRLAQRHKVELRLLGTGDRSTIDQVATPLGMAKHVCCDGILPAGQPVLDWLDSMDCYIQPSLTEGLPRSVIEAMSRGLPCVGTRVGGIPELLDPACIIDKHDDAALAQRIERLIADRGFAAAQARRNFDAATGFYADRLEAHREAVWGRFLRPLRDGAGATMPPSPSD